MAGLDRQNDKYDVELLRLQDRFVVLEYTVQKLQTKYLEMTSRKVQDAEDDSIARKIQQLNRTVRLNFTPLLVVTFRIIFRN